VTSTGALAQPRRQHRQGQEQPHRPARLHTKAPAPKQHSDQQANQARGRHGLEDRAYPQRDRLAAALALALAVDSAAVAAEAAARGRSGPDIGAAVHAARAAAIAAGLPAQQA
jgi:hypothetical protein